LLWEDDEEGRALAIAVDAGRLEEVEAFATVFFIVSCLGAGVLAVEVLALSLSVVEAVDFFALSEVEGLGVVGVMPLASTVETVQPNIKPIIYK